jgi:surface antigen
MTRRTATTLVPPVIFALLVSSCSTMTQTVQENPKAVLGTLIGAGAGAGIAALAGGGPGAIAGAAVGGALIGGLIGNRLDARDKQLAAQAAQRAFESNSAGQSSEWQNPDSGHSGSITPTRTYQLANGQYCREYRQTIVVGGQQNQASGTACRQPDGTWQIQS